MAFSRLAFLTDRCSVLSVSRRRCKSWGASRSSASPSMNISRQALHQHPAHLFLRHSLNQPPSTPTQSNTISPNTKLFIIAIPGLRLFVQPFYQRVQDACQTLTTPLIWLQQLLRLQTVQKCKMSTKGNSLKCRDGALHSHRLIGY